MVFTLLLSLCVEVLSLVIPLYGSRMSAFFFYSATEQWRVTSVPSSQPTGGKGLAPQSAQQPVFPSPQLYHKWVFSLLAHFFFFNRLYILELFQVHNRTEKNTEISCIPAAPLYPPRAAFPGTNTPAQ